jgi:hypothetical protein
MTANAVRRTEPAPNATPVPTHKQIDALILEYAAAAADLTSSGAVQRLPGESAADLEIRLKAWHKTTGEAQAIALAVALDAKARLLVMVAAHGVKHAEKSMRLSGVHNQATVTRGTRVDTLPAGVAGLKAYVDQSEIPGIAAMFFVEHTTYSLVAGPAAVLKTLDLGGRIRARLTTLIALCFDIKSNAPSLKIDAIAAAKPNKAA